jgi:hypothetical protein
MASNGDWKECLVVCKTSQGVELRGSLLRLTDEKVHGSRRLDAA